MEELQVICLVVALVFLMIALILNLQCRQALKRAERDLALAIEISMHETQNHEGNWQERLYKVEDEQ